MYKKDLDLERKWQALRLKLKTMLGKKPRDLNGVLFLIGVQELGKGPQDFTKEEKQDLMHIAVCRLLSYDGHYEFIGRDDEGWPHYELISKIPPQDLRKQEALLKSRIVTYFDELEEEEGYME